MGMPSGIGMVDTMIGFPQDGDAAYGFIRKQTKDQGSNSCQAMPGESSRSASGTGERAQDGGDGLPEVVVDGQAGHGDPGQER